MRKKERKKDEQSYGQQKKLDEREKKGKIKEYMKERKMN